MTPRLPLPVLLIAALASAWIVTTDAQSPDAYRIIRVDGTQSLPLHASQGTTDIVTLDAVARLFDLLVREDARAGGVVLASGATRVVLTAGQSTVSVGGRLQSLSGPVTRAGTTWLVPVDVVRALGGGIEVRRGSRLIVVPPAVVPRVTPALERSGGGARLTLTLDPGVTSRVTREGPRVTVRLQATAIDLTPLAGSAGDLVTSLRADGPSLIIDLGPSVTDVRTEDGRTTSQVVLTLVTAGPPAGVPAPVTPAPGLAERSPGLRTVVIDPGHGGDDIGIRTVDGLQEKALTLALAQRLKAQLEARIGVRVVLTRDQDVGVTADRRAALANTQMADLFVSLHANGAPRPGLRGAQVLSLDASHYAGRDDAARRTDAVAVPVVGGGTRLIDTVPWPLAQLPHVTTSATVAAAVARRLAGAGVVMHPRAVEVAPLRVLVGANMPAVLIEVGFLTNAEDVHALRDPAHLQTLTDAIVDALTDVRGVIAQGRLR